MRDRGGAKRPLPLAPDAQDGAMGQAGIHTHPAKATHHETAAVPARQAHVRQSNMDPYWDGKPKWLPCPA